MAKANNKERFLLFGTMPESDLTVVRRVHDQEFSHDLAEAARNDDRYNNVLWVDRERGTVRVFRGRIDAFMLTLHKEVPDVDTWDLVV